ESAVVDDLALMCVCKDNRLLGDQLTSLVTILHNTMLSYGMSLKYRKGKSAILLSIGTVQTKH
ncbi:unnamed protein product, partial [Prorocentrum cordatum]